MGTTTSGKIFFGIVFPDDFEFPWSDSEELDFEEWYYKVIYTDKTEEELDYEFRKANPMPFELEYTYSYDYPQFALILKEFLFKSYDDCIEIEPSKLTVNPDRSKALVDFCVKYFSECEYLPELNAKWYLSGMHG